MTLRRDLTLAIVLVLGSGGCTVGSSSGPAASGSSAIPTAAPTRGPVVPSETPFPTDDDFATLMRSVLTTTSDDGELGLPEFWPAALDGVDLQQAYAQPAAIVSYRGGDRPASECAKDLPTSLLRENAFYCDRVREILYDEAWLRDLATRFGRFAPAAIAAHEWGHHVQQSFGGSHELEADCLAGMYLAATEERLPGVYDVGGDVLAALATFFSIGSEAYPGSDWLASRHGTSLQRIMAVGTGYLPLSSTSATNSLPANSGIPWCHGYRDFAPRDQATIGPYRLINLPGRTETITGTTYVILPDDRTGLETSRVELTWIEQLPLAGDGATAEQLDELWRSAKPTIRTILEITDTPAARFGTRVARLVEIHGDAGGVRSGIFDLLSPADAVGGLSILATRDTPAPTEVSPESLAVLQEQLAAIEQIINRLCDPDDSARIGDPNLDVACLIDQQ
jgi:hypothetical protein